MCLAHRTSVQVRLGGLPDLRNGCLSLCWQTLMELKVGTLIGSASTSASAFVEVRFGSGIVRSAFGAEQKLMSAVGSFRFCPLRDLSTGLPSDDHYQTREISRLD